MKEASGETETIKRRFNRTSVFYDVMDKMISIDLRKRAIGLASGRVLEIGVGTGTNLPFYPADCDIVGIDFSSGMLSKAREKASRLKRTVTLLEMDAQHMDFPDQSFDTVVATCVFCSVPNPIQGLTEVRRVCKTNGQIILLEHVRSDNPILGPIMDLLNPMTLHLIGSNINRRTVENVSSAGISIHHVEDVSKSKLIKLIIAAP